MIEQFTTNGTVETIIGGKPLTPRQQAVWELVRSTPGGVDADEVGALLHSRNTNPRYQHATHERCQFCGRDGKGVLRSVALKQLVVRKHVTGRYHPRNLVDRLNAVSAQLRAGVIATSEPDPALNPWADL